MQLSPHQVAKLIDHALLQPTMTDVEILDGLALCARLGVAAACVKPYSIEAAVEALDGTGVAVCSVIGFPHGNSTTQIKALEAADAAQRGATEIDMVVNNGKVVGADWSAVKSEIQAVNDAVAAHEASLKVIFEVDYLNEAQIIRLCEICSEVGVAFVKTSTGYGFVRQSNGMFAYTGATPHVVQLMRMHSAPEVEVKAAGGVRTLDELYAVVNAGATRIGTSSTAAIVAEAQRRAGLQVDEVRPSTTGY